MAGDDPKRRRPRRPPEQPDDDELSDLRVQSVRLFMVLSAMVVVVDSLGRLFRDPAFRVDPVVMGMVFGTLLALLGLEVVNRLGGAK